MDISKLASVLSALPLSEVKSLEAEIGSTVRKEDFETTLNTVPGLKQYLDGSESVKLAIPAVYTTPNGTVQPREYYLKGRSNPSGVEQTWSDDVKTTDSRSFSVLGYVGIAALTLGCATVLFFAWRYFSLAARIKNLLRGSGFKTDEQVVAAAESAAEADSTHLALVGLLLNLTPVESLTLVRAIQNINVKELERDFENQKRVNDRQAASKQQARSIISNLRYGESANASVSTERSAIRLLK